MSLQYGVSLSSDVEKLSIQLKAKYSLTDFEALSLALEAERNELLKIGFVISSSDSHPTGLEAIAIGLGFEKR